MLSPTAIRACRERANITREQAAVHVRRSFSTIRAYEYGDSVPPSDVLGELAALYGCGVGDFFTAPEPVSA